MESQTKRIKAYLQSGRTLTPLDALHSFNCFRLSGRIYDLKKQGLLIKSEYISITSGGKQKKVARYSLIK